MTEGWTPQGVARIAIYGKGGIGKSTISANVSAALADQGLRVLQIGCDPKADSTAALAHRPVPTVLDAVKDRKSDLTLDDIVIEGYGGVLCVEAGGPTPGIGCAGRGIIGAFERLERLKAVEAFRPDVILYDVLGDVVCGGFAVPMREGYARDVFIVTSGERMSLFAAHNIAEAVRTFRSRGYARLGGIVFNAKGAPKEEQYLEESLPEIGGEVVYRLPRDPVVQECEERGITVIEGAPDSALAGHFRALASVMLTTAREPVPV